MPVVADGASPAKSDLAVLVLCTGNSARSIMAEALLNGIVRRWIRAYSAGSRPTGKVQPLALALIGRAGFPTSGLRSKSWAEFTRPGAPRLDYVITVCDGAASEPCPIFPGEAVRIHWPLPDPAAPGIPEAKREQAFAAVFQTLIARVRALDAALLTSIDTPAITDLLRQLGSEAPCITSGA
jgi:arsenate reductase